MSKFIEILNQSETTKSLVLGNGFGLAFDRAVNESNFNWSTLLDLCDIDSESPIYNLLKQCNLDFELAHQKLNSAIDVVSEYEEESSLIPMLNEQIKLLRKQLVQAVTRSHPLSLKSDSSDEELKVRKRLVRRCRKFLKKFDTVFSLNYDLLLYWVRCFNPPFLGRDSFYPDGEDLVFSEDNESNYFFPHGALFLYRIGAKAIKLRSSMDYPILARVEDNIKNGVFPMCISEGTGTQKLESIKSNTYLLYAYNRIKQCEGDIFTFGCSFQDQKDDHIIRAMIESPAERIIVGEHSPNQEAFHRLKYEFERVKALLKSNKEIIIADTEGAEVW